MKSKTFIKQMWMFLNISCILIKAIQVMFIDELRNIYSSF